MEDTLQELEARVATLESQKRVLQNKLSLAKQHIMDLGGRTQYKYSKSERCKTKYIKTISFQYVVILHPVLTGKTMEVEAGVRRAAQTAPPRYGPTLGDSRAEMEKL